MTIDLEADSVEHASGEAAEPDQPVAETEASTPPAGETPVEPENPEPAAEDGVKREETAGAEGEAADFEAEASQADAEPAREEEPRGRAGGVALALLAGFVGGAVVAGGMQFAGGIPGIGAGSRPDPALAELRQQVETMSGEVAQLRESASAGSSEQDLEQALAEPRQQISELRQSVAALQEAVSSGGAGENAGLQALDSRIADLESRLAELSEAGAQAGNGGEAAERISALASDVQGVREAADAARQAANANAEQLQALTGRLDQLAEQVESQDEGPRLALVVAASALQAAVERGEPFARELETYSALAPDAQGLAELRQYADTGIPTRTELAEEAPAAASRIAAISDAPEGAGFLDRLMASARSAITVRPVGEVEGEAPEAIAARMEAAVQRGDYTQALAEYESLPPEAQEAASAFAEELRARQAADRILEETLSSVLKPA